jgi:hypothetical protein
MIPVTLVRVVAPHFVAGLLFAGAWCVGGAPILGWARGKAWPYFSAYAQRKGWALEVLQ